MVTLFKALAEPTRLRLVGMLAAREMCGQDLARELAIAGPTVTHHLALLKQTGVIEETRQAPYSYYRLDLGALQRALRSVARREHVQTFAAGPSLPSEERRVLNAFFDGPRLKALPAQAGKREVVFREILRRLPRRASYKERELNEMIEAIHPDYCAIRRAFIDLRYMRRERGTYRLTKEGTALTEQA